MRASSAGAKKTPARELAKERRRFTLAVLAREILRDATAALDARGISVMPLKGVLFQLVLYRDPADRLLSDVDILVPAGDFGRAIDALMAAGFEPVSAGRSLIEAQLRSPKGMAVDLHRQLFSPGRYKLSTRDVFSRASRDDRLLGLPLFLAHPYDTAAHLIGKFVSDHVTHDALARLAELARWVAHCQIDPERLAKHLQATGMARAARYMLAQGIAVHGEPFFTETFAALPFDPLGAACTRFARAVLPRIDGTVLAPLPAHLLNCSLPRAGASAALVTINRFRHARMAGHSGAVPAPWAPFFPR